MGTIAPNSYYERKILQIFKEKKLLRVFFIAFLEKNAGKKKEEAGAH